MFAASCLESANPLGALLAPLDLANVAADHHHDHHTEVWGGGGA